MVFFIGGLKTFNEYTNEVIGFDLNTFSWSKIQINGENPLPALCSHGTVTVGESILIFGGATLEEIKPDSSPMENPAARRKPGANKSQKKYGLKTMYVFETSDQTSIFDYIDTNTHEEELLESPVRTGSQMNLIPPQIPQHVHENISPSLTSFSRFSCLLLRFS